MNGPDKHNSRTRAFWFSAALLLEGLLLRLFQARAQAPGDSKAISASKVERKNRAPVSKEILRIKLPQPVEATLPNGMTVLILEDHRFPIVTVDFSRSMALGPCGSRPISTAWPE